LRETQEEKIERLLQEKVLLVKGFEHPGTQMIFLKLKDMARASLHDYDNCDFATERGREMAHRIQARRYVILQEIPRIIDEIINVNMPREDGKKVWKFNAWLEGIRKNIGRFFRL
jgi:hypothetical protein